MAAHASRQSESKGSNFLNAAVLTPAGRGAVATISVRGPADWDAAAIDRHFVAANGRPLAGQSVGRVCFGLWTSEVSADHGEADPGERELSNSEEVVVSRRVDGLIEVCCHGGPTAVERILNDLRKQGVDTVPWQEHLAASSTSLEAEMQSTLTRATTKRTALKLLELESTLPVEFARLQRLARSGCEGASILNSASAALSLALAEILKWVPFGLHLTTPWRVVLAGRPNVGKSTLMNALAGFTRAIVFDEPGTTRDVVSVETALAGWPVLLLDTAGIRDPTSGIEREGVSRSRRALGEADCVCLMLDASAPLTAEDQQLLKEVSALPRSIVIASKVDLGSQWGMPDGSLLPVSAVAGTGLDELIREIVRQLVPDEATAMTAVPVTPRQVSLLTQARQAVEQADFSSAAARLSELNHGRSN